MTIVRQTGTARRHAETLDTDVTPMRLIRPLLLPILLLAAGSWGVTALAAQADPVAVMVRVAGAVQVHPGGRAQPVRGAAGVQLRPGARVVVPTGAQAILLWRTGKRETLTRSTVIQAPRGARRGGVFQQTVRTLREVATTDAGVHPNRQGMIRPLAGAPVPLEPRGELRVSTDRPRFAWSPAAGATSYLLQIRDTQTGEVRRYPAGADSVWHIPHGQPSLAWGGVYEWSVATDGGRASPPQRFRVAPWLAVDSVNARLAELREAEIDPEQDGLFLAALLWLEGGFPYEAARALDRLAARGEGSGRPFHQLRGEVYDRLGMLEKAAAAFQAAEAEPAPGGR